jgi:hypothetical protein
VVVKSSGSVEAADVQRVMASVEKLGREGRLLVAIAPSPGGSGGGNDAKQIKRTPRRSRPLKEALA